MRAYADTSFLVSLYVPETRRTERAVAYMERKREALPFTPFHRLELRNAIWLMVWLKRITATDRSRALGEVEDDLDAEIFLIHTSINFTEAFRHAEQIGAAHNERVGSRSSDLLHVAAALQLGFKQFLTFDQKQLDIARAAGLRVDF